MRAKNLFIFLGVIIFGLSFASEISYASTIPGNDQFSLNIEGLQYDDVSSQQTVSVDGRDFPIINLRVLFSPTEEIYHLGYYSFSLYLNDNLKNTWGDETTDYTNLTSLSPDTYGWNLCNGDGTNVNGIYVAKLKGNVAGESTSHTIISKAFTVKGTYTCGQASSTVTLGFTRGSDGTNNVFRMTTTVVAADYSKYHFYLFQTPPLNSQTNTQPPDGIKAEFTPPSTMSYTWDSTGSAVGTHTFTIQALPRDPSDTTHPVIKSLPVTAVVDSSGKVTSSTGGEDGTGGGGGGSGGGQHTNVNITPLKFTVPDLSSLSGKTGMALFSALSIFALDIFLVILSILAGVAFIWSGIIYSTSFGDEAKMGKAKKNLLWATTGVLMVVMCYFILNGISSLLGLIKPV